MKLPVPNVTEDWGDDLNAVLTPIVGDATLEPAIANALDDEFDDTSTAPWSATPTPATGINTTDRPGALVITGTGTGDAYVGKTQPILVGYPYTITTKVLATNVRAGNCRGGGIILTNGNSGASSLAYFGHILNSGLINTWFVKGTLAGGWGGGETAWMNGQRTNVFFRLIVNSATSVTSQVSWDGTSWFTVGANQNPGFAPTRMGLAVSDQSNGGITAYFDFFRVT